MGRLIYIDPMEERRGNIIEHPYEDYSMAVDLIVRIPNRYSCGFGETSGEETKLKYSFFGGTLKSGSDGYLTSNFTDISMTDPLANTSECFGIESLSINYNEKLFPIVSIKFVDVRGATLMSPSEALYQDKNNVEDSRGLYRAFFVMPYPTFVIIFKGFYGKGASFRLTLQKADIEFNSETGNFNITAVFIGQMYGIYADLPLSFINLAPYTSEGKAYWEEQVSKGRFKFRNLSGERVQDMIKMPELREKIAKLANNQDIMAEEERKQIIMDELDSEKNRWAEVANEFPFGDDWKDYGSKKYLYKIVSKEREVADLGNTLFEYYKKVSDLESGEYEKKYSEKLKSLSKAGPITYSSGKYGDSYKVMINYSVRLEKDGEAYLGQPYVDEVYNPYSSVNLKYEYKNNKNPYDGIGDGVKDSALDNNGTFIGDLNNSIQGHYVYLCFFPKLTSENVFGDISYKQAQIEKRKEERKRQLEESNAKLIEDLVGFRPSVRNIYELVFAHMETFMHCFYSTMGEIKNELTSGDDARKKDKQEVRDEATDTSRSNKLLPPYTAFYKKHGNEPAQMVLPNEVVKFPEKLKELTFIENLINAAEVDETNVSTEIKQTDGAQPKETSTPSTNDNLKFFPITFYDFINSSINPYSIVESYINETPEDIAELIMGIFAMRAFYFLNNSQPTSPHGIGLEKYFGEIEALNLFKALGNNNLLNSDTNKLTNFVTFIRNYANGSFFKYDEKKEFSKTMSTPKSNGVWTFDANGPTKLFKDDRLKNFNYSHLPLTIFNPVTIKETISSNNFDNSFLNTKMTVKYINYGTDLIPYNRAIFSSTSETFYYKERKHINDKIKAIKDEIGSGNLGKTYDDKDIKVDEGVRNVYDRLITTAITSSYPKEVFGITGNTTVDITADINNGNIEGYFIKYPSWVDNEDTWFGSTTQKGMSIFAHGAYTSNLNVDGDDNEKKAYKTKFRAYLFLGTIPLNGYDAKDGNIESAVTNGVVLKSVLLREGSYYWYEDSYNGIKNHIKNDNIFSLTKDGTEYYLPDWDTTFGFNTINPIKSNKKNIYKKWRYPNFCTTSRRKKLKAMFEDWAIKEFGNIESSLIDIENYEGGKYAEGLSMPQNSGPRQDALNNIQTFLKSTFFDVYTTIEYLLLGENKVDKPGEKSLFCVGERIETSFGLFIEQLDKIYGGLVTDINTKGITAVEKIINDVEIKARYAVNDIRLSTYMTLKNLYERWLCTPHNGPSGTWTLDPLITKSDFNRFKYLDSFHRDIGDSFLVNLGKVNNWLSSCLPSSNNISTEIGFSINNKSVYEFLSIIAENSGAMLMAVPQKLGEYDKDKLKEMFTPYPLKSDWLEEGENFVFLYSYQASSHLGGPDLNIKNMNGYPCDGDGFNLTDPDIDDIFGGDGIAVPGFAVTYAKQNQSLFKNIRLNTNTAGVTDVSIASTMNIASQAAAGPRETMLYGQDIYHINSNKSFRCEVECMGNSQIMPLMYFQLNNIPFWGGAYQILKVSHNITPGNFTTRFEGIRVNRYSIPMMIGEVVVTKEFETDRTSLDVEDTMEEGVVKNPEKNIFNFLHNGVKLEFIQDTRGTSGGPTQYYMGNNNVPKTELKDCSGNINISLDTYLTGQLNGKTITEENPIIYIHPAHNPRSKGEEHKWSVKVVEAICEKLVSLNYNVVKGRKNNNGRYTGSEAYNLVKKYGSKQVIALVPHYNAHGGNNGGKCKQWQGIMNGTKEYTRLDSVLLMDCIAEAAYNKRNELIAKLGDDFKNMISNDKSNYMVRHYFGKKSKDCGTLPNCACALTENWYGDYIGNNGKSGWQWLHTETAINLIADFHVDGIVSYINNIKKYKNLKIVSSSSEGVLKDSYKDLVERFAKDNGLVEIPSENGFTIEMKYSTTDNCTGINLYKDIKKAYFISTFANKIKQALIELRKIKNNYSIKIWDALRPDSVQFYARKILPKLFSPSYYKWDAKTGENTGKKTEKWRTASYHIHAQAVDLTIVDENDVELNMGADFDDPDPNKARFVDKGITLSVESIKNHVDKYWKNETDEVKADIKANRVLLYTVMTTAGLKAIRNEWWHFQDEQRGNIIADF